MSNLQQQFLFGAKLKKRFLKKNSTPLMDFSS